MNVSAWIAAGSTVISLAAVCATFYGIIHTNKVNRDMQSDRLRSEELHRNREMLREKGEELYRLIHDYRVEFRTKVLAIAEHLHRFGQTQGLADLMNMDEQVAKVTRMEMLVRVYFPNCQDALNSVSSVRSQLTATMANITGADDPAQIRQRSIRLWGIPVEMTAQTLCLQTAVMTEMQKLHADVIRR